MVSPIGEFLRKLRIEKGELMKEMAKKLGVTSAFLSAVENGKKNVPKSWESQLIDIYNLDTEDKKILSEAIVNSAQCIKLNLIDKDSESRKFAVSFARSFDSIGGGKRQKILEIINEDK